MKASGALSFSPDRIEGVLRLLILAMICVLAFSTRLFSVLRFESVIHEYDPHFNYRVTKYFVSEGLYNFINWFDVSAWYPLGRIVGGTLYPGLMYTSGLIHWVFHALNFPVLIRNVCVLLAPGFAGLTAIATYLLTKEVHDSPAAGLVSAAMVAIVPGYISRSVAGSYDNEGIAIFALIFTFYMWVKSVKTGSLYWSTLCSLVYFYMVTAWGGYIFIINLIPLHVLVLLFTGRYTSRLYIAYTTFYVIGTILAMQIRFVNFQAVQSSEHMLSLGVFGLLQIWVFVMYVRDTVGKELFASASRTMFAIGLVGLAAAFIVGQATGFIAPWTGRFYSFLDPTYAKEHIPIIASVSEHQPTTWASFFFDLHLLVFLFPVGLYFCFRNLTDANLFVVIYGITSIYFAGVMVRLMLVLAPISCVLAGIAVSEVLKTYSRYIKPRPFGVAKNKDAPAELPLAREIGYVMVAGTAMLLVLYVFHCTWVTSEAYSSPSIVLAAKQADGSRIIFDDFREAYWWLQMNTPLDTRVMSWWDYGYQLASMANRTTLVDNNTWNNSHIAEVGTAFASTEQVAYPIMRRMDVDYVLVIFGGLTGYASDDINKFLWMVRIGGSTHPNIKETDYYTRNGEFRVDAGGSPVLLNTLMYKLCYYRFGAVYTERGRPPGFDRVRNVEIGNKDFELEHLEEAFTSQHWIVRLYKVKKPNNRLA